MVTAYDAAFGASRRRGRRRRDPRRRLARHDRARLRLHAARHDRRHGAPHRRRVAAASRARSLVADMPFLTLPGLARGRAAQRRPPHGRGRRARGEARGRRGDRADGARAHRGGHPRHGPRRPHAAVGAPARRLQGAGEGDRPPRCASSTTAARCRPPARSPSCSSASPPSSPRSSPRSSTIPTIGIGAGAGCDGQVQVFHDLLGLGGDFTPRHAKRYADVGDAHPRRASRAYADEVRAGDVPRRRARARTWSPRVLDELRRRREGAAHATGEG